MRPSEWLRSTVNVTEEGTYAVAFRVASPNSGTSLNLAADGTSVATVVVPNAGAWDAYSEVISMVNLTRGVSRPSTLDLHGVSEPRPSDDSPSPARHRL